MGPTVAPAVLVALAALALATLALALAAVLLAVARNHSSSQKISS